MRNWINRLFGRKALSRGTRYEIVGGNVISSSDNKTTYLTTGYAGNDIVYSIINLIKDKAVIAPWGLYKVVDESSLKKYKAILNKQGITGKDYIKALYYREKALEETEDERLSELVKYPNDHQSFNDLFGESCVFKLSTGGRMIWGELLDSGANSGKPYSLETMPYDQISIIASRTWPVKELGYSLDMIGRNKVFTKQEVLHDKYPNPVYDIMGSHLYGLSPLKPALSLLDKSNSSTKAATAMFQNGGPRIAMFVDDDRFSGEQTGGLANDIKKKIQGKEYNGPDNTGKILTSAYKVGVVPLGSSMVDLALTESDKSDLRRFCNIFGAVPSQLLNDPENKTYNNQKEGEKALTTRGAMPLLVSFRDAFNRKLQDDWGYNGVNICVDFGIECFPELQDDLKAQWEYVSKLPISWRSKLEMMGIDADEDVEGLDEVMIQSGFEPLDSYNVVDESLQEGDI